MKLNLQPTAKWSRTPEADLVMAGANEGAIKQGGISVGIYLEGLLSEQFQNPFTTHNIRCKTLLARQHLLLSGAEGAVIAPEGGAGTVFELTHMLIEMRRKVFNPSAPIVFVDDNTMWGGLRSWFSKNVVGRGLMSGKELEQTYIAHSPAEAIGILQQHLPKTPSNLLPFVSPRHTKTAAFPR
jgi:predicted Rossmann-fold nucleotide-binding protein